MGYVVVGLGNPGEAYARTRHNAGRIVVSLLAEGFAEHKKAKATVAKGALADAPAVFVLPDTFMNRSGAAVAPFVKSVPAARRLAVVYDDLDLPLGTLKVSFDRGSGGHKGVESIARTLKTKAFLRIRIGISPVTPSGKLKKPLGAEKVEKHIMGKFSAEEEKALKALAKKTRAVLDEFALSGIDPAMTLGNTR